MYLGSKIFNGNCVCGNKTAPVRGKTASLLGKSEVELYDFIKLDYILLE
jgi:hypothetical protein